MVLAVIDAGALASAAAEEATAGRQGTSRIAFLSKSAAASDWPLRVSLQPRHCPIEAESRIWSSAKADPQDGWPYANGGGNEAGFAGSATYADLDNDGDLELLVGGRDANIYAWHHDGTMVSGWPFTTGSYVISHVAVGDVDGDAYPEVVVNSNDGRLYVLSHDGVSLSGWPKQLEDFRPHTGGALYQSSPMLADLAGDGRLDIIFSANDAHTTYAFDFLGQDLPGWPILWDETEFNAFAPAVGDLDGDGSPEVLVGTMYVGDGGLVNLNKVYAWHGDGSLVSGWPVILEDYWWSAIHTVALADVDADHALDVLVADSMNLYVLHADGTMHPGWPYVGAYTDLDPRRIAVANLDGDEELEIVTDYLNDMLVFDSDGTRLSTYPIPQADPNQPVLADVDGDGRIEIVSADDYPHHSIYAWNEDGSLADGFPLATEGFVDGTPLLVDLDGDGDLEVAAGDCRVDATALHFFVWDLGHLENPELMMWPMFQRDQQNTGGYSAPAIFVDGFETGDTGRWSATYQCRRQASDEVAHPCEPIAMRTARVSRAVSPPPTPRCHGAGVVGECVRVLAGHSRSQRLERSGALKTRSLDEAAALQAGCGVASP